MLKMQMPGRRKRGRLQVRLDEVQEDVQRVGVTLREIPERRRLALS